MSTGKRSAGYKAAEYVQDGMVVGFGTGSTADYFTQAVGERYQRGELPNIIGVPTSRRTKEMMESLGIPVASLDDVNAIDYLVDGADETTPEFRGIKGGGGALLHEKIVAENSHSITWIVTPEKLVDQLGAFPLPVEVVQYGSWNLFRRWEARGYAPTFRKTGVDSLFMTDSGNYIIDLHLDKIDDPDQLAFELNQTVGVVDHGFFLNYADRIITGNEEGEVSEIQRPTARPQ